MSFESYDQNRPAGGQQGGGQQPYSAYQQQGYTGYQPPVDPQANPYGYPQNQQASYGQPYGQVDPAYGQQPNPYGNAQQNPYGQPYGQGDPAYGQQPNPYGNAQQNPYGQPYDQGGYPPYQQGFQGGYPYQAGGVPQSSPVIPPPQQPAKEPVDVDGITRLVIFLMLPVLLLLFVLGMVLGGAAWLKWVFVGLSLAVVGTIWVRPLLLQHDLKLTFSCVLGALSVVAAVSALTTAPADSRNPAVNQPIGQQNVSQAGQYIDPSQQQGYYADPYGQSLVLTPSPAPTPSPTPVNSGLNSEAVQRMMSFFYFWQVNNTDSMLNLCAPSWIRSVQTPMNELFRITSNRTPTDYEPLTISGTDNDVSRTISANVTIDRNMGQSVDVYSFKVVMLKENDMWYVDPKSLQSNEKAAATTASAMITQPPTPAPVADPNAVMFYNPSGGTRYHIDPECKSTNPRYLPFVGEFTYGELNNAPYIDLQPCNVCGAPLRPDAR